MPHERWLPVVGYEEHYLVSDQGRVWSVRKGRCLKPRPDNRGYLRVRLPDGPTVVHRLVLSAFVGPRPYGHEACHGDGDKANARLQNLRWGTRSENARDRVRHGTFTLQGTTKTRTHCPRRHALVEPNLVPHQARKGYRECLACSRAYSAAATRRRHGAVVEDMYSTADAYYTKIMAAA